MAAMGGAMGEGPLPAGGATPGMRLADLAAALGRRLEGDPDFRVTGVAALERAGPGDLVYVRSARFAAALARSRAGAAILPEGLDAGGRPAIRSPNPGLDFARAARHLLSRSAPPPGVDTAARLAQDAEVHPSASVGAGCVLGAASRVGPRSVLHANVTLYDGVRIGADCVIHAGCVLREGTELGDRVVLQPGVVLGGDGFGYAISETGALEAMPQLGRVVVGDDVEIGANTTVDRGALGETRIESGAKLDNLVQVGHNVVIGASALVVAQAGIAGSTRVGRGALIMSQAGIPDHVTIGERAYVGPKSGVHGDVEAGARVMGYPHREMRVFQRIFAALGLLPALVGRVRALERERRAGGGGASRPRAGRGEAKKPRPRARKGR
jgi:UDP-3-O-[3-hydroxymyristoyl] glucosamine N-acyltransferase